jgi:hypothetical protein
MHAEGVDVLVFPDVPDDRGITDVLRVGPQREDAAYRRVRVELLDDPDDLFLGRLGRHRLLDVVEPYELAVLLHLTPVHLRAEILSDEQCSDPRGESLRLQSLGLGDYLALDLVRYGIPIDYLRHC